MMDGLIEIEVKDKCPTCGHALPVRHGVTIMGRKIYIEATGVAGSDMLAAERLGEVLEKIAKDRMWT